MFKKILIAIDGSDHAGKAADVAIDMAKTHGAELVAVHVTTFGPLNEDEIQLAEIEYASDMVRDLGVDSLLKHRGGPRAAAQHIHKRCGDSGLKIHLAVSQRLMDRLHTRAMEEGISKMKPVIAEGDPAESILRAAREHGADLIVLGTRGLGRLKGLLLGSVSHKVTHLAECPCLTVR